VNVHRESKKTEVQLRRDWTVQYNVGYNRHENFT